MKVDLLKLEDDGRVPNHPRFPLLMYRGAFVRDGTVLTATEAIATFSANGWNGAWVNGIFAYHHYHASAHEVLANVGDAVEVQFGGAQGPVVTFPAGAVAVIPAGCGHCRVSKPGNLEIVGAYPAGQESWDLKRADNPADYAIAKDEIKNVARPEKDPVTGNVSPLLHHWV